MVTDGEVGSVYFFGYLLEIWECITDLFEIGGERDDRRWTGGDERGNLSWIVLHICGFDLLCFLTY